MKPLSILYLITLLIKQSAAKHFTSVKGIIITNAITSSVITTINREIINSSNLVSDINKGHFNYNNDIIYSCIITSMFFLQYNILYCKEEKFKNIGLFANALLIIGLLFIKYIPSAY